MSQPNYFVADGYSRLWAAVEAQVQDELNARQSDVPESETVHEEVQRSRQIAREVQRRMDEMVPPETLF